MAFENPIHLGNGVHATWTREEVIFTKNSQDPDKPPGDNTTIYLNTTAIASLQKWLKDIVKKEKIK